MQCGLSSSEARHFEFEMRLAIGSCLRRKFRYLGRAIDSRGHQGASDSLSILLFPDGDVQVRALSSQPGLCVDQFYCERRRKRGIRTSRGLVFCARRLFLDGRRRRHKMQCAASNFFGYGAMLVVNTFSKHIFAFRVERQQIDVVICAAMQHAAAAIDGGVDQTVRGAAVFGLDVIERLAEFDIRVMPEKHIALVQFPCGALIQDSTARRTIFLGHLTDWRLNGYYSASPMSDSGLQAYTPLLIHLLVATALAGALTAASVLVGWRRPSRAKQLPYECGMEPTGDARAPVSVRFYLVAMVFILFDVEAIFLYPWAFIYRDFIRMSPSIGLYGFMEMMVYIAILLVGYFYLWKKGALDWHKY